MVWAAVLESRLVTSEEVDRRTVCYMFGATKDGIGVTTLATRTAEIRPRPQARAQLLPPRCVLPPRVEAGFSALLGAK